MAVVCAVPISLVGLSGLGCRRTHPARLTSFFCSWPETLLIQEQLRVVVPGEMLGNLLSIHDTDYLPLVNYH